MPVILVCTLFSFPSISTLLTFPGMCMLIFLMPNSIISVVTPFAHVPHLCTHHRFYIHHSTCPLVLSIFTEIVHILFMSVSPEVPSVVPHTLAFSYCC